MAAGEQRRLSAVRSRIGRVQRRLNLELWVKTLPVPVWVGATVWAVVHLFLPWPAWPVVATVAIAVIATTTALTQPKRVSTSQAAVIADREVNAGGLLLTRLEVPVGPWELGLNQQLKSLRAPPLRVARPLAWALAGVGFGLAIGALPQAPTPTPRVSTVAATHVDRLEDKIEALAAESPTPESLATELARLQNEVAQGTFDDTDWEAADSLDHTLDQKAELAAAALANAERAAAQFAEALAHAQGEHAATQERDELERALMQLSDGQALQNALEQQGTDPDHAGRPSEGDGPNTNDATGSPKPNEGSQQPPKASKTSAKASAASAQALRQALQRRRERLAQSLGQPHSASAGLQSGPGQPGPPSDAPGSGHPGGSSRDDEAGKPGGGGGGASRPIQFGDEAPIAPERLEFAPLPEGHGGDEPGTLYGLQGLDPRPNGRRPVLGGSGEGARGDQGTGFHSGPLLPRNRALVERYFHSN